MTGDAATRGAFPWKDEWRTLALVVFGFAVFLWPPVESGRLQNALLEGVRLAHEYARDHVLLCLVPAIFIAGTIAVFLGEGSVMRYLGPDAPKLVAYGVASVSGSILAVCSCTVLPLFTGIHRMGAGLGPATAFLYSGPAINVLSIVLTARVLGARIGIARAVGAIGFAIADRGVLRTPALAIDGVVRVSGRIPSAEEIEKLLA